MTPRMIPVLVLALCTNVAAALDLYISPQGNDAWSGRSAEPQGRSDGPYATLEKARDEIRKIRADAPNTRATVHIRAGDYFRDRTFELDTRDAGSEQAPITWRAYRGEKVRLIGGRRIEGFTKVTDPSMLERLDPSARDHVVQANLKSQGITDFGKLTPRGFGRSVQPAHLELFFNGVPMSLARWPNEGWVRLMEVPGGPKGGRFTYEGDRPRRWSKASDVWVRGFWTWDWADSYEKVKSIDFDKREIATEPPHGVYGYKVGARFHALNLLEEIDAPGEWYLDREAGVLYFWPPSPVDSGEVIVSVLDRMVTMTGASHVSIEHLGIEAVRGTAIHMKDCTNSRIAGCTLRNIGNLAVVIESGTHCGVEGCDITATGEGGISLSGGDRKTLSPSHHYAANNDISDYSRWVITYRPAVSIAGVGVRVAHNLIHDAPHMGIALSGNEHLIELNEVHHVCMDTDDAGAFYMGRDWTQRGNIVRNNYWHHIGAHKGHIGVQAIYLDDWSSGTLVYGNICYKAARAVLCGGGRDNTFDNNVFIDCTPAIHVDSRGLGWAKSYFDSRDNTLVERLAAVPYREPPWSTRYPELLTLYEDEPALAKGNVITRNICVGGRWLDFHDGLTDKVVRVEKNMVNEDPHFVDPERGNFQLRDDSPAFEKIGFERVPFEKMGLYQHALRASWPPASRSSQPG